MVAERRRLHGNRQNKVKSVENRSDPTFSLLTRTWRLAFFIKLCWKGALSSILVLQRPTATVICLDFKSVSLLIGAVYMCKLSVWKTIKASSVISIMKRKDNQTSKQSIQSQFNQFDLILLRGSVEEEERQLSFNQMEKSLAKMEMAKWS